MTEKKIYIIIVNYRNWQDTQACISSVLASSYPSFTILVVDNNSGNGSLEQLKDVFTDALLISRNDFAGWHRKGPLPKILLIQNENNAGFAAANNVVLQQVQHEDAYIWLLNPDMIIMPDTLQELLLFEEKQPDRKIIGAVVKSFHQKDSVLFYGGGRINFNTATVKLNTKPGGMQPLDYISGASLFTHCDVVKKTGLLPSDYFLYWEETDWCYKAKSSGVQLSVCPTAVCFDKISTVIGKGFTAHYYYTRNGLFFVSAYRKGKRNRLLFSAGLRWLKRICTGQWGPARGIWRGVIDYLKNKQHAIE